MVDLGLARRPGSGGDDIPSRTFEQSRLSVPAARDWVLSFVSDLSPDLVQVTALLASELVTNAVLYGCGRFQVSVERSRDQHRVRVGVTDAGKGQPTPRHPDRTAEHGRGLQLVKALATAWGVRRGPCTKTVWFELRTARPEHPQDQRTDSRSAERGRAPAGGTTRADNATAPARWSRWRTRAVQRLRDTGTR
ncbi:MAG TPA: ATP-binding protein [Micromonosporaceae bacterium]